MTKIKENRWIKSVDIDNVNDTVNDTVNVNDNANDNDNGSDNGNDNVKLSMTILILQFHSIFNQ